MKNSTDVWRVPFGFQLVPCGIMLFGLFTVKVYFFRYSVCNSCSFFNFRNLLVGSHLLAVTTKLFVTLLIFARSVKTPKLSSTRWPKLTQLSRKNGLPVQVLV